MRIRTSRFAALILAPLLAAAPELPRAAAQSASGKPKVEHAVDADVDEEVDEEVERQMRHFDGSHAITADRIAAHIRFLADDLLEGRGPGTRADRITQLYIATQLQAMGYQPGGEDGTYLQPVPLLGLTTTPPPEITVRNEQGQTLTLENHDDFIVSSGKPQPETTIQDAPFVFVGYGITAPEYDWDDYDGIDVKGKIVVVMNNDPEDDPELFEGRRRLYYGRWDYKYHNAAAHGAAAAVVIHTDASAGYPFSVVQTSWSGEESELREGDAPRLDVKAWVTEGAARQLMDFAGRDLDELRRAANSREFQAVPLPIQTTFTVQCKVSQTDTANVLAVLPGSDPELADEYVMLMAHHDHIGIAPQRDASGDAIYNGAIDNASGIATLLSIADAFSRSDQRPSRSILIAAVGAEEQGLLGSKHFAAHPTVPPGKIAGLINMDGMNFLGRTVDLQVIGFGKSSIDALVEAAAAAQGRKVVPDQFIDRGYYYRSDQFSLARVGVPGLYLHAGTAVRGKDDGWGREQLEKWTDTQYHQPSDEYDPTWDLSGAVEDTLLLYRVAREMADAQQMQSWNPGDEFEAARQREIERAE